jgi:hypothetical protein
MKVILSLVTLWVLGAVSRDAHAESMKVTCGRAYDATQVLRKSGQLIEARVEAITCSSKACPRVFLRECTAWTLELEAAIPTVVIAVKDGSGNDVSDASVTLDGKSSLGRSDGKAVALNPGEHELSVAFGSETRTLHVTAREGERARSVNISFARSPTLGLPAGGAPSSVNRDASSWPWVVGSIGVGALGVAAGFGIDGLSARSSLEDLCNGSSPCAGHTASDVEPLNARKNRGLAMFIGFGAAGAAGVISGIVGILGRPAPASAVAVAPLVGPGFGGIGLRGTF